MKRKKDKRFKMNELMANWSRSDNSNNESELKNVRVNLCFMAMSKSEKEVGDYNFYLFNEL